MTQLPQAVEIEEILINGSVTQIPQAVEIEEILKNYNLLPSYNLYLVTTYTYI